MQGVLKINTELKGLFYDVTGLFFSPQENRLTVYLNIYFNEKDAETKTNPLCQKQFSIPVDPSDPSLTTITDILKKELAVALSNDGQFTLE